MRITFTLNITANTFIYYNNRTRPKHLLWILVKHENQFKSVKQSSPFRCHLCLLVIPDSANNACSDWLTTDLWTKRSMRWTCSAGQYLYANEQDNTQPIHRTMSMNGARMNIHKQMVTRMWLAGVFITLTISSTRQDKLRYPVDFPLKCCKLWLFRKNGKQIVFIRCLTLRIMCQFFWHSVYFGAITSGEVPHPKLS